MTKIKNKILIILDGTEDLENSLRVITESNLLKCDQIVLFFILNPFNPITKGQEKEVLYNDFVHDHGRRLASLYIEKLEAMIYEKNKTIKVTHNLVNSFENIKRRLGLDDIDMTVSSIKVSSKLNYAFKQSKNINHLISMSKNLLIIPYDFLYKSNLKNNVLIAYSENDPPIDFDYLNHSFNIDKITFLYDKKSKLKMDKFIDDIPEKTNPIESLEISSNLSQHINILNEDYNLIFLRESKKIGNFWKNFSKYSNYYLFDKKIPLFFWNES